MSISSWGLGVEDEDAAFVDIGDNDEEKKQGNQARAAVILSLNDHVIVEDFSSFGALSQPSDLPCSMQSLITFIVQTFCTSQV